MNKLLTLFTLLCLNAQAQNIKIGDIAISDSLAKEYFLDCQINPIMKYYVMDILAYENPQFGSFYSGGRKFGVWYEVSKAEYLECKKLEGQNVANPQTGDGIYYKTKIESIPRTPSASDFAAFMRRKYKTP